MSNSLHKRAAHISSPNLLLCFVIRYRTAVSDGVRRVGLLTHVGGRHRADLHPGEQHARFATSEQEHPNERYGRAHCLLKPSMREACSLRRCLRRRRAPQHLMLICRQIACISCSTAAHLVRSQLNISQSAGRAWGMEAFQSPLSMLLTACSVRKACLRDRI